MHVRHFNHRQKGGAVCAIMPPNSEGRSTVGPLLEGAAVQGEVSVQ